MPVPNSRQLLAQTAVAFLTFLGVESIVFPGREWTKNVPAAAFGALALLGYALYRRMRLGQQDAGLRD